MQWNSELKKHAFKIASLYEDMRKRIRLNGYNADLEYDVVEIVS